eukprot:521711_1
MVLPIDGQPIVTVHKSIPKHKICDTIDSVINNLSFAEKAWKFGNLGRNSMTHYQRNVTDSIRRLICHLSSGDIAGFVSSILTETEQLSLSKTKPILNAVNQDNVQCNLYHHICHLIDRCTHCIIMQFNNINKIIKFK